MAIKELSGSLDEMIQNKEVLVDFYANWCGPCKMLSKELESIKDEIEIIKVDIEKNMDLCKKYGVMSIPTLIYFKNSVILEKCIGFVSKEKIKEIINTK